MTSQVQSSHGGYLIIGALVVMLAVPMIIGHFALHKPAATIEIAKVENAR